MSHLNAEGTLTCVHQYEIEKDNIELPNTRRPSSAANKHLPFVVLDGEDLERPYVRECQKLYVAPRSLMNTHLSIRSSHNPRGKVVGQLKCFFQLASSRNIPGRLFHRWACRLSGSCTGLYLVSCRLS